MFNLHKMSQTRTIIPIGTILTLIKIHPHTERWLVVGHSKAGCPIAIPVEKWHPEINFDHILNPGKYKNVPLYYPKMGNWAPKQAQEWDGYLYDLPCTGWAIVGYPTVISPDQSLPSQ